MSRENAEIVREVLAALAAGDLLSAPFASDVEFVPYLTQVDGRVYKGRAGVASWLAEMNEAFKGMDAQLESIRSLDDRHVLALGHTVLTGSESGATIDFEWAQLARVEAGEVVALRICANEAEALEAAGLSK